MLDWLSGLGNNVYSWAGNNPMEAGSLGLGAAATGLGAWDMYRSGQEQQERRKLAESMMRMGPRAYAPSYNPEQLKAMYFRPAATFMAERGITSGGAFTQGLADAALKAEADRIALGNSIYGNRLGALGYGPTRQASGSVGGLGQALQNIQLMRALNRPMSQYPQQQAGATYNPGTWGGGTGGLNFYPDLPMGEMGYSGYDIPSYQLNGQFGLPSGAPGDGRYSLSNPFGMGITESLDSANRAGTAYPDLTSY